MKRNTYINSNILNIGATKPQRYREARQGTIYSDNIFPRSCSSRCCLCSYHTSKNILTSINNIKSLIFKMIRNHHLNFSYSNDFLDTPINGKLCKNLPIPIQQPLESCEIPDFLNYKTEIAYVTQQFSKLAKSFTSFEEILNQRLEKEYISIPKGILEICHAKQMGIPYPVDYNPYYTTGLLDCIEWNNKQYFVRIDNNNCLSFTDRSSHKFKLKFGDETLGIIRGFQIEIINDELLILLRTKDDYSLWKFKNIDELGKNIFTTTCCRQLLDCKKYENSIGLISDDLKFTLRDIENNCNIYIKENKLNRVIQFEFLDENNIGLVNIDSLKLYDIRSCDYRIFSPKLNKCNKYCNFILNDPYIYIATRHYLIRTDVRNLAQFEYCTHMMQYSPCFMDFIRNGSECYLALSSQESLEKIIFNGNFNIGSLPWKLQSAEMAFKKVLTTSHITKNFDRLQSRIRSPTIGIKLSTEGENVFLDYLNCYGDIFKQQIVGDGEFDESWAIDMYTDWINQMPMAEDPVLVVTDAVNLSDLFFTLHEPIPKKLMKQPIQNQSDEFLDKYREKYTKRNLSSLASNFAVGWEEGEEYQDVGVDTVPQVDMHEKVSSWIEANYFQ